MRVLVTGAGGMVGRNVLDQLGSHSWTVAAPRRNELDLSDYVATRNFMRRFAPDLIIHAAGLVGGIQANITAPLRFLVENIDIGRNTIAAALEAKVPRFLNLGSSCIYPRNRNVPLKEVDLLDGELEPTNEGYALAKIVSIKLCQYVSRESPLHMYKSLVPCNLYGRYDHFEESVSHLVPAAIRKVHRARMMGARTIEIWGDGTARREFMYAGDLAEVIVRASDMFDLLPSIMNVGVGADYSVREYYEIIADVVGWSGTFTYDTSKPTGMRRKLLDVSLQTQWGWRPTTGLREGIAATYRYFIEEQG